MYRCGCIGIHLPPEQHVTAPDPKEERKLDFMMLWQCGSPKHDGCGPTFNITRMDDSDPSEVRPLNEDEIKAMAEEIHSVLVSGRRMRSALNTLMLEMVENFSEDKKG